MVHVHPTGFLSPWRKHSGARFTISPVNFDGKERRPEFSCNVEESVFVIVRDAVHHVYPAYARGRQSPCGKAYRCRIFFSS